MNEFLAKNSEKLTELIYFLCVSFVGTELHPKVTECYTKDTECCTKVTECCTKDTEYFLKVTELYTE